MGVKKKKEQPRTKRGGTSVRPMLNVRKDTTSDRYTLVIQILRARRRGVVFTPFKLQPGEFDPVKGRAISNPKNREQRRFADNVNRYLRHQLHEIDRIVSELERGGEPFDGQDVAGTFRRRYDNRYVHTVFRRQIEEMIRQGRHGTAETYHSTLTAFGRFAGKRHYQLCELDEPTVMEFRDFLVREGLKVNTVTFYLCKLRAVYNRAVREGFAPRGMDPFGGVAFRTEKTRKLAVDDTVLRRVAGADLPRGALAVARDLFLFSFYCRGMSFVDMTYLRQRDIEGDVIRYRRRKTGQLFTVRIIPPLRAILDRYREICSPMALPILMVKDEEGGFRPFVLSGTGPDEQRLNEQEMYKRYRQNRSEFLHHLRRLSKLLGLERSLTFNMARHTWASRARREGIPMTIISEGLGHTSEKTTRIYLDELEARRIDEANEVVTSFWEVADKKKFSAGTERIDGFCPARNGPENGIDRPPGRKKLSGL